MIEGFPGKLFIQSLLQHSHTLSNLFPLCIFYFPRYTLHVISLPSPPFLFDSQKILFTKWPFRILIFEIILNHLKSKSHVICIKYWNLITNEENPQLVYSKSGTIILNHAQLFVKSYKSYTTVISHTELLEHVFNWTRS